MLLGAVGAIVSLGTTAVLTDAAAAVSSTPFLQQIGTSRTEGVGGVAVSSCGGVYTAGTTSGTLGRRNAGQSDGFLVKMSAAGTHQWTRQFGTGGREHVSGVATSPCGGSIYVVGYTDGTFPKAASAGGVDGFLAKYTNHGTQLWVKQFGTTGDDLPRGIAVSSSGWVYVTGTTDGAFPDFLNAGGNDGFLAKFSSSGTRKWVVQTGTTADDELAGVAVSKAGDVYVTGETLGTFPALANSGDVDAVLMKFDKDGVKLWTTQFGTASFDHSLGVAVSKLGEVYAAGYTGGAFPTFANLGDADAFLAQYDSVTGTQVWMRQFGTAAEDHAVGVAVTKTGIVFAAGLTYGSFPTFANAGGADGFAAIYSSLGTQTDLEQHGTSGDENVAGVAVAKSGDTVVAGGTQGSFPGFANAGNADVYVIDFEVVVI